ncbi:hypothetical protein SO802_008377 [Lithocarpus litseifolius]|uniref:DUF21 domain-containing protein n=1 Tax=Lithocarpus litseifolius TaxID=425828 RepID=A0AAW2DCA5_9ROSI
MEEEEVKEVRKSLGVSEVLSWVSRSHNLAGVKVLHGIDKVVEGGAVVLTLKDQNILADGDINEEIDMLENVELREQKQRDEAYKAAKKKTGIYEDKLEGASNNIRFEDLNAIGKTTSDYYTQEEMLKFKKPKKKKALRKKEKLDLDALEAEALSSGLGVGDLVSRNDARRQAIKEEQERAEAELRKNAYQSAYAKADEASKSLRMEQTLPVKLEEDENPVFADEDDDLYKSLERARKLALKKQEEEAASGPQAIARLATTASSQTAEDLNPTTGESQENKALPIFLDKLVPPWAAILISVTLILAFGEIIPQAVCTRYGLTVGATMAPLVRVLLWLFLPISYPISKMLDWMLGKGHAVLLRRAELKTFVNFHGNEAGKGGDLTHDETTIITGALELTEKTARDAMTPITNAFSLELDANLNLETLNDIMTRGHSRVPVYAGKPTNLIGLVLATLLTDPNSVDTDMDAKVKAMIKLIEEDADSIARRAEMYYKKRPELMKLVEEFYRAYRALAERYDHAELVSELGDDLTQAATKTEVLVSILGDDLTQVVCLDEN